NSPSTSCLHLLKLARGGMSIGKRQCESIRRWRKRAAGALVIAVLSFLVWSSRVGEVLDRFSCELFFLLHPKPSPRSVVIVRMHGAAHQQLNQSHGVLWDRGLHARLLERLRVNGARMVVFDVFFTETGTPSPT